MRALLLRLLLLAGIGVNVAFLLINLKPDRPHFGARRKARVVLRAGPARAQWVKENLLSEFAAAHDVDFELISAKTFEEVLSIVEAEKDHPTGILLADINDELSDDLHRSGALRPIADIAPPDELGPALAEYVPEAVERGRIDGKVWYLPKRALIDIAIYLKPAVEDLVLHWEKDRPAIQEALKEANGVGLPRGYDLSKTPDGWDWFDLFVAGWYWAHHPAPWADSPGPAPRIALRTGLNEDALNDMFGTFFSHGLKEEDVGIGKLDAPPVLDTLQWRALFRRHHLLDPACEKPEGIDAFGVNDLIKSRKVAWAPINQSDSLWVHGGSRRDAEPGMVGATDIDWATMPEGSSLELLESGEPARKGPSFSLEEVHFWAVPIHSPHPALAWELARFLTQRGLHQRETEAQGLFPVRRDIADEYPILFRLDWMQRMLDASYRQAQEGTGDMPDAVNSQQLDKVYAALREHVLNQKPVPVTLDGVRRAVASFTPDKAATGAKAPKPEAAHAR